MLKILKRIRRDMDQTLSNESSRLSTSTVGTARNKTGTLTVSQKIQQSSTPTQLSNTFKIKKDLSASKIQSTSWMTSSKTTVSSTRETQSTYTINTKSGLNIYSSPFILTFTPYRSKNSVNLHQSVVLSSTYTPKTSIFVKLTTSYSEAKSYSKSSSIDHINLMSLITEINTSRGIVSTTPYNLNSQVESSNTLSSPISQIKLQILPSVFSANLKATQIPQTASTKISRASLSNKNVTQKTMVLHRTRPASSTTGPKLQITSSYISTPSLVASVRSTLSLSPLISSKLSISIRGIPVTSSLQYVSSSISATQAPKLYFINGSVEFDGDCHIYTNNETLKEDLIRQLVIFIEKKLPDVNVTFSQNSVRCGSVIIDFRAYSMSDDIEQKLKNIFLYSNITVNNQILGFLNIMTHIKSTPTPDVTTKFSTETTTEPTKKSNFTVLYVTVFVIAGIVIIIIIVVIAASCQKNSSGSFSLSDGKANYELGAINGDSKSTINMYGVEPTLQNASDVNESEKMNEKHDKNDNSNEYQLGHLPKWELPILELDTPGADVTKKKEMPDSCEGIENKGLDTEE